MISNLALGEIILFKLLLGLNLVFLLFEKHHVIKHILWYSHVQNPNWSTNVETTKLICKYRASNLMSLD